MTKRPPEEITDHEDPEPAATQVIAHHALPYPFGDQTAQSLFMWTCEQVLQHSETPLTDKTRQFIKDLFADIVNAGTEQPPSPEKPNIKVVK